MGMLPYAARGAASIAVAATGERSEVRQVVVDVILLHRCNIITSHWSVARSLALLPLSECRSLALLPLKGAKYLCMYYVKVTLQVGNYVCKMAAFKNSLKP